MFQHLQLEIVRTSNDQSIFAWDPEGKAPHIGSILADDLSFFRDCDDMDIMELDTFTEYHRDRFTDEELCSIRDERLGFFLVTNHGIQICLPLSPYPGSHSVFTARLACYSIHDYNVLMTSCVYNVGCRLWMNRQAYQPENPELTLNEIYTLQQEVDALQEKFDQLEDEELKWVLEQDIVGKVRFRWMLLHKLTCV